MLSFVVHRGVWVIFSFSAVLMVITLVHFVLGIVTERAICEPLQNPENNQLLMLVDKIVRLDKFFDSEVEINVSSIIRFVGVFILFWNKRETVVSF
jgi:prominin 1